MSAPISFTKTELSCPLFDVAFDPYNRGYLVVGGGGGESGTGVANTIALLDVNSKKDITVAAQIDLPRGEDSVQSLASLTTPDGLVTFAGINSSAKDQKEGKNEHLRSFKVDFPKRKSDSGRNEEEDEQKQGGSITFIGKNSLLKAPPTGTKAKTYQRLLRFSPVRSREAGTKRIGALASGGSPKGNEIVLFDATSQSPKEPYILARLEPVDGVEAVDLDLDEPEVGVFALVYCTDTQVFVYNIDGDSTDKEGSPTSVYTLPRPAMAGPKSTIRCLRWLSDKHVLLLCKKPAGGAELLVLQLGSKDEKSFITLRKTLPRSLEVAAEMDVCCLDTDIASGERQIIIAVAGQDRSRESAIHILTLDYTPSTPSKIQKYFEKFHNVTVLNRVHPSNIMKLTFNNFFTPKQAPESNMSIASTTQYVKLASVAWGGTVDVETLSLTSTPTHPSDTAEASAQPSGTPSVRWVLSSSSLSEKITSRAGLIVLALTFLLCAILAQSFINNSNGSDVINSTYRSVRGFDAPGAIPPFLRSKQQQAQTTTSSLVSVASGISDSISIAIADASSTLPDSPISSLSSGISSAASSASAAASSAVPHLTHKLHDLLRLRSQASPSPDSSHGSAGDGKYVYVSHSDDEASSEGTSLSTSLHADPEILRAQGAKSWRELSEKEKALWKRRLVEVGHWEEGLPENILLGVFFSQWANIVGGGIRDALLN